MDNQLPSNNAHQINGARVDTAEALCPKDGITARRGSRKNRGRKKKKERKNTNAAGKQMTIQNAFDLWQLASHEAAVAQYLSDHAVEAFLGTDGITPTLLIQSNGTTERAREEAVRAIQEYLAEKARIGRSKAHQIRQITVADPSLCDSVLLPMNGSQDPTSSNDDETLFCDGRAVEQKLVRF
jgi:hypothetical protein